jgi:hypothetical protein
MYGPHRAKRRACALAGLGATGDVREPISRCVPEQSLAPLGTSIIASAASPYAGTALSSRTCFLSSSTRTAPRSGAIELPFRSTQAWVNSAPNSRIIEE